MHGAKRHRTASDSLSPWTVVAITIEWNAVAFVAEPILKPLLIDAPLCHVPDPVSGIRALVPLHTIGRHKRPNRRLITSPDLPKPFWLPTASAESVCADPEEDESNQRSGDRKRQRPKNEPEKPSHHRPSFNQTIAPSPDANYRSPLRRRHSCPLLPPELRVPKVHPSIQIREWSTHSAMHCRALGRIPLRVETVSSVRSEPVDMLQPSAGSSSDRAGTPLQRGAASRLCTAGRFRGLTHNRGTPPRMP